MEKIAWGQFALVFWCAACLFAYGARTKKITMTRKVVFEISQGAFIVVLLLALATEGRGLFGGVSTRGDAFVDECVGSGC